MGVLKFLCIPVFLILIVIPISTDAQQDEIPPNPSVYHAGMIFTNLGDIDEKQGTYWMDFIIYIESDEIDFTEEPPLLSFVNSRDLIFSDELIEPDNYKVRVQGEFFSEFDYRAFPFQTILLKVEIEPKIPYDADRVIFKANDEASVDPTALVHGWTLVGSEITDKIHTYPDGFQFSRLIANIEVSHKPIGVALSIILPVTIITAIALFVFFIPHNFTPRIYLTAPLLLAIVYWHQSQLSDLPMLGYMTFFDKLILIYYALVLNGILCISLQMRSYKIHADDFKIRKINRFHAILMPIIFVAGMIILWYI